MESTREPSRECTSGLHKPATTHTLPQSIVNLERKKGRRVFRRFVTRGGELVEIEAIVRETR